ncbi:hypothetical protein ACQ4LE_002038 [Meloidogyne hapla]|uniref:F-box domain-containing protein n=1 Tax=Meloidogyne hapla TaxID=6305 RepID=A0A1I8B0V2_MELHA
MYSLPVESQLDILKNLNINQLNSVRQTNRYFNALIGRYEGELARKKFKKIAFSGSRHAGNYKFINIKSGLFRLEPTSQLMAKWKSAVDRRIPVYLRAYDDYQPIIKLYIGFFKIRFTKKFILNLPIIPKNIKEIKIIRCWIEKISHCYYDVIDFFFNIFNPELIQLIFDNEEIDKIKFNCRVCDYFSMRDETILFCSNRLVISEYISFSDRYLTRQDLFGILIRFLLKSPKVFIGDQQSTICKLILNHIETSEDYSNITFNRIGFPHCKNPFTLSERAKLIEEREHLEGSKYTYHLTNMHNPNVKFSISFSKSSEEIVDYFQIERIRK